MTQFEAKEMLMKTYFNDDASSKDLCIDIDKIYADFDDKEEYLRSQIAYWKLSFKKQCEATNDNI